jgi:UDP-N-acetylglucosamine 2-epimerase (non-hydrolysing)
MMKVLSVFGTRPEAIKMAPLVKGLEENMEFNSIVCVTAQHREMLDQVLSLFEINPDLDLNLMSPDQDLYDLTWKVLLGMREVLETTKPDLVFVQGDTTTTFATALACFYAHVPIAHVEAGLRTGNMRSPFPEEGNRCLTTKLAAIHFCPTEKNRDNLLSEGIEGSKVWVTGNTVIDALLWIERKVENLAAETWRSAWSNAFEAVEKRAPIILITGHRRENFGDGIENICLAVRRLASSHQDWHFIYPVHLNPNVLKPVREILNGLGNVHLIRPLDYGPFVFLMKIAKIVLTDSGGIQEEAPALGKPVLVMRDTTERPEALSAGTVKLVGTDQYQIVSHVEALMTDSQLYNNMAKAVNPYGDGRAVSRILEAVIEWKHLGGTATTRK